ncbi:MAG TPA: DinB family protein, partial [Gemmataceae bacterium]|nr:DinB family protein [Gemmataceae bacterium]
QIKQKRRFWLGARCMAAGFPVNAGERKAASALESFTMNNPTELIDSYLKGPALLRQAVAGLSAEQLKARPVAGKWSTLEVVCHIADFEPIMADRMKRIIALQTPLLFGADENEFAKSLSYHDRDLQEELAIVENTRKQMARILRKLPAEAWQRSGNHSERGLRTLEQFVVGATNHIPHHVAFIQEKRKALGC